MWWSETQIWQWEKTVCQVITKECTLDSKIWKMYNKIYKFLQIVVDYTLSGNSHWVSPLLEKCTVSSYASLSVCLSVCMSLDKNYWKKSYVEQFDLGSSNLIRGWASMISRSCVKVKGQGHHIKNVMFDLWPKGHNGQGQTPGGSRSKSPCEKKTCFKDSA